MPFVLFGRYRDNVYLLSSNIPPSIKPWVEFGGATFLRSLYGIPLKWELHPVGEVAWGESLLRILPHRLSLKESACPRHAFASVPPELEWDRWVRPASPNAKVV